MNYTIVKTTDFEIAVAWLQKILCPLSRMFCFAYMYSIMLQMECATNQTTDNPL